VGERKKKKEGLKRPKTRKKTNEKKTKGGQKKELRGERKKKKPACIVKSGKERGFTRRESGAYIRGHSNLEKKKAKEKGFAKGILRYFKQKN